MDWARDLPVWPNADTSRRIRQRPHDWHVQETGSGPDILLLHGAGASTHSWRGLLPVLSKSFRVIALDLPGHGFTRAGNRSRLALDTVAEDIATLCAAQEWHPRVIVGHSAGAAVAIALSEKVTPCPQVITLNAALDRFDGFAGWLFPAFAKMLALNPFTSVAFAMGGGSALRARAIITSTGSQLSEEGYGYYARLLSDRAHVDGTLQMMARWNTDSLYYRLPEIETRCLLVTGARDTAVPPRVSAMAATRLPQGELRELDDLGHLAHEEDPETIAQLIEAWIDL
ncbi:MAG: alpha/beta fold hydrolase BchO [Pseudomonadota bacterium]